MKQNIQKNELFQASHLTILVSFTIFSVILIGEALLLSWEKWALLLISIAVVFSWGLHIRQQGSDRVRLWIYSCLMMCTFFFYGIHLTSTFDLATVMTAVIILYTMTGIKALVTLCQITFFVTMGYDIGAMAVNGAEFDVLTITRLLLHIAMIVMVCRISRMIIDKWTKVLGKSEKEIQKLTDATDRLNDFLANVSHEIRTPINAVIGLSGICADKEQDPAIRADMISVNEAGVRVAEQISDILDYSEIDRGMLARNDEDYTLSSLLNDLVIEVRPYKPEDIELVIDVDPLIPSVMHSDPGKLKRILRHLIINGLKYTREGGVYVRLTAVREIYGVNLCIEVTDTGIGMTPEESERILERFYQANSGRTRSSSGLGLGMAIVSGFVGSLGGFMHIASEPGKGTSVYVSVPQKVVDDTSCMSINEPERLSLGALLHFEKFQNPSVRDYYNIMVKNIVSGLGVKMHRVDNTVNLEKLLRTVRLTHLFVGEEEYEDNRDFIEELGKKMTVAVVANGSLALPERSNVRIMEKPFYCFPVASVLNEDSGAEDNDSGILYCAGVRALVVDDEPMNLTVAKSIFSRYGMTVFTADSGQRAIDLCRDNTYDIVFMDHMMPGMDGVEAMKRIRADSHRSRGSEMPIVALTANAVSTAREMFLSEGFDGFVSKPVNLIDLERVLKKVLPSSVITYKKASEQMPAVQEDRNMPEERSADAPFDVLERGGIDTKSGLNYCMNDEGFYMSLLMQFESEYSEKRSRIENCFAENDLLNYKILVHGLKSTSKMIGCTELSENARQLETAAREGRTEYITSHHAGIMEMYEKTVRAIAAVSGEYAGSSDDSGSPEVHGIGHGEEEIFEFEPDSSGEAVSWSEPAGGEDDVIEFFPQDGE
ncbi:MAG: response regulator [Oscillospiraceae bacterium]|nr:response regulator [Oscillospiraceae bacterium]